MSRIKECPNCKQPVDEDNAFCIFCGAKIPVSAEAPSDDPGGETAGTVKKCANGHEFDDPKLDYCPVCGLPLTSSSAPAPAPYTGETWKCSCGAVNPEDDAFCQSCGKARKAASRPASDPKPGIPEGMYVPTDADLLPKKPRS